MKVRARALVVAAVFSVLALTASAAIDRDAAAQRAARGRLSGALVQLGVLAGLRSDTGAVTLRPLPVAANLDGGPLWLRAELEAAIAADEAFVLGPSPNLVRVEVVGTDTAFGLSCALFRQGWNLKLPRPTRVRVAPWVATVTAVLGLFVAFGLRRVGAGLAVAGGAAQLVLAWLPWEVPLTPASWSAALAQGPAGTAVLAWARALPDSSVSIGAGVVALCAILIVLDHRRSRRRGGTLLLAGLAGAAGVVAWGEAALRAGASGWAASGAGVLSMLALVAGWAFVAFHLKRRR